MAERDQGPILPVDADLLTLSDEVRRLIEENRRFLQRLFDDSLDDEPEISDEFPDDDTEPLES